MTDRVFATAEARRRLMGRFGVSATAVSNALRFKSRSGQARQVRSYAVNFLQCAVWMAETRFI